MKIDMTDPKAVAERIKALKALGIDNLTDDQIDELDDLNKAARKMKIAADAETSLADAKKQEEDDINKRIQAGIEAGMKTVKAQLAAEGRRLPSYEGAPYAMQFSDEAKFDHLNTVDLAVLMDFQSALAQKNVKYVNGQAINVSTAAYKALSRRVAALKAEDNSEEGRIEVEYVKNAFKAATGLDVSIEGIDTAIKAATDPMYSGGSGIGSDWVATAYSSNLWRKIRALTQVVSKIPSEVIPDGYSSQTWPLESTDITWYKVAEATASDSTLKVPAATVPASQIATGNKNIGVGKLGARGLYTGELDEDSIIRFAPQLRNQIETSGSEMLESLVLDGDVETSANKNINNIDGTPTSTDYFLTFDGMRKLALVTNTANSLDASGGLTVDMFLNILKLMGTAGIAGADLSKVNFILDGNVHYAAALLPEVKTKDVHSAATLEGGFIKSLWNVGVIPSWQMQKASSTLLVNTAGKISGTPSNNTRGAALAVRWDQWKFAYKRRMTMETTRIANADTWEIVALTRVGLGYRDNEASAILYNIGV